MKKKLLVILVLCLSVNVFAQTSYNVSYSAGSGNPGGLNNDTTDNVLANWNSLLGGALSTNQWSQSLTLPFPFQFYGNSMTSLRVSANGLVTFAVNAALPDNNTDLPSALLPDSTIACFWDAFTNTPPTSNNDSVIWRVFGTAPNRQLWLKWVGFEIGSPAVSNVTFSCVLEETTNNIYMVESEFTVGLTTPLTSVTTGLQLNSGTATQYDNKYRQRPANAISPADNNYIMFSPYTLTSMSVASVTASQPVLGKAPRNSINNAIIRVNVSTNGELSPLTISELSFNTNGTTVSSDITAAKVFYTGNDSSFNSLIQFGSTTTNPFGNFNVTGTQVLEKGDNYFWLAYDIATFPGLNFIDGECSQAIINSTPVATTNAAPAGNRQLSNGLSGTISVGTTGTYALLSEAFKAINDEGLSDHLNLSIISDITDTGAALLTHVSENNFMISITPSDSVVRNIVSRINETYIDLSGSRSVTFNGNHPLNPAGKYLRFINQSDSGSTFRFSNGAHHDTIKNCVIEGAAKLQTMGLVHIANTNTSVPNHHIEISNNDIRDRSDSVSIPAILVYSKGSANAKNHHISILNNNLFNYMRSGVYVEPIGNDGNWKINGNSFYYNSPIQPLAGDLVSIMLIPGPLADTNEISNNYFGGTLPQCGGSAWINNRSVNFVVMNISSGVAKGTSVQGNTIQNMNTTPSANPAWIGIRIESGRAEVGNISGNLVGHLSNPNSIVSNLNVNIGIYGFAQGNSEVIVANNTVANFFASSNSGASGFRGISFQLGAASPYIVNNTVRNITSASTISSQTTTALAAIAVVSGTNQGTIYIGKNRLYDLTCTAPASNITPTGIAIDHLSTNGIIESNTIYNIFGTSSTGSIHGIYIQGPAKEWIVRNNMISLTNGSNIAGMTLRGISDNASGNTITYLNNSVHIGGTAANTANSFAFERRNANSIPKIMNNIFYNERTGGTGIHAAIANTAAATNWTSATSGYNLLVSASPARIGSWSTSFTPQSFNQWQTISTGDNTSWSDTASNIPSSSFFKDVAIGDLSIDTSVGLCWYVNGKGIAVTANNTDKDNDPRSTAITGGATDIGADEFNTAAAVPLADTSGTIQAGDSTTFTFAGRTIAKVYWVSGSFPTSLDCRYFTGEYPPSTSQPGAIFNSYLEFSATGSLNGVVDVVQYYDSARFGTVSNSASIVAAHRDGPLWNTSTTSINPVTRSFRSNGHTSLWLYTGSDILNPVPVKLLSFEGRNNAGDANLTWSTAMEKNASHFEIEVGTGSDRFEKTGIAKALGNTNRLTHYSFVDANAFEKHHASRLYYRLKIVDRNGSFEYSKVITIDNKTSAYNEAVLYPNPFTAETKLVVNSHTETNALVSVTDVHGKMIANETIALSRGTNTFMPQMPESAGKGIYFITVVIDGESQVLKMIK
jgi:hypothetical protein